MSTKRRPGNLFSFWYSLDYNLHNVLPEKEEKASMVLCFIELAVIFFCEWLLISKTSRKISGACTRLSSLMWDDDFGVKCDEGDGRRLASTAEESVKEGAKMGSSRESQARRHPLCN